MTELRQVLDYCLINLDFGGLSPIRKPKRTRLFIFVFSYCLVLVLAQMKLYYEEIDLRLISAVLQTTTIVVHMNSKVMILYFKRHAIKQFVDMMYKFWDYRHCSDGIASQISGILSFLKKVQHFLLCCGFLTALSYAFRPFVYHVIPIVCYLPSFIPFYPFAIYNESILLMATWIVINYDLLTCSSLILVYCQFIILNDKITNLNLDIKNDLELKKCQLEIKEIVDHHNFLKEVIASFNEIFNMPILIQYFLTVVSMCFEFLRMAKTSTGLIEMLICFMSLMALFTQILMSLSFPSMLVIDEASKISLSVYKSKWMECKNDSIKKQLLMISTSTVREIRITAGYLFSVDLESCTQVLKTSFSFFTFINTVVGRPETV